VLEDQFINEKRDVAQVDGVRNTHHRRWERKKQLSKKKLMKTTGGGTYRKYRNLLWKTKRKGSTRPNARPSKGGAKGHISASLLQRAKGGVRLKEVGDRLDKTTGN